MPTVTCLIIFESHMNILSFIKVNTYVLITWSYMFPQPCRLLSLEWLACFELIVQSLLNTCLL